MKTQNTQEIQDIINGIDTGNLLISANGIAHSYEHDNLDEGDIYCLLRDVISVVTSIEVLKETLKV